MHKLLLIFLISINISLNAFAMPKIVTSISPLGSVISNLTRDAAKVDVVFGAAGCPHDYYGKPSDLGKVKKADLIIYIDDDFDGFFAKLANNYSGPKIRVSELSSVNFQDENGEVNWHFWLDLDNIIALKSSLTKSMMQNFPEFSSKFLDNSKIFEQKIKALEAEKSKIFSKMGKIVVLSDSLDHFFGKKKLPNIMKLYQYHHASLKSYHELTQKVAKFAPRCILIDKEQDHKLYEKMGTKVISIDSDNWQMEKDLSELFFKKYREILKDIDGC